MRSPLDLLSFRTVQRWRTRLDYSPEELRLLAVLCALALKVGGAVAAMRKIYPLSVFTLVLVKQKAAKG